MSPAASVTSFALDGFVNPDPKQKLDSLHVLIIDDSVTNCKMLKRLLSRKDISCEMAENGRVGLDRVLVDLSRFGVIFIDNLMPEMDGVEATREMRKAGFSNTIVGLTGVVMNEETVRFIDAGADEILSKPLKLPTLERILQGIERNGVSSVKFGKTRPVHPPEVNLSEALIVDDSLPNLKMLCMLLKKKQIKCETAENGQIALDKVLVDLDRFKLIVLDNLMPVMTGLEAAKKLREAGYGYIIVGLTGNILEDDIAEFIAAGADIVLSKPLQVDVLDRILKTIEAQGCRSTGTGLSTI